jgi:protein SCO1/2
VIINSFFASCTGSCPETDTPPKLKEYAERMGAKQGWYFLTGTRAEVDAALRKIGQYAEAREMHKNIIIAGNDRTGLWKKAMGVAKADEVYEVVASVVDDRGAAPPAGGQ